MPRNTIKLSYVQGQLATIKVYDSEGVGYDASQILVGLEGKYVPGSVSYKLILRLPYPDSNSPTTGTIQMEPASGETEFELPAVMVSQIILMVT